MVDCPKCGLSITEGMKFCPECGVNLAEELKSGLSPQSNEPFQNNYQPDRRVAPPIATPQATQPQYPPPEPPPQSTTPQPAPTTKIPPKKYNTVLISIIAVVIIVIILIAALGLNFGGDDGKKSPSETDSDGDGVMDDKDAFINDPTQWADRDGDGYGDNPTGINPDAFPDDPSEYKDSDSDGIGDNADICDVGNGGIQIKVVSYVDDGSGDEFGSLPDPYFTIRISTDSDDEYEYFETSSVFWDTSSVDNPFKFAVDTPDDLSSIAFIVEVRDDEWDGSYELIDYRGEDNYYWSRCSTDTCTLPQTFSDNGAEDLRENELDCSITFKAEIVEFT